MNIPKYTVKLTSQFKKDYKSAIRRNMNLEALQEVIIKIANGEKRLMINIATTHLRDNGKDIENVILLLIGC